jgi:MoaA/NifB/PqqE/SkfB family radical SAM enzyme
VESILNILDDRPIVIWGARITGIGFCLFAKKHNLNVIGFIDSDLSLIGMNYDNSPITSPESLSSLRTQYKNLIVVVAVTAKEDEITDYLNKTGMSKENYIQYKDFTDSFFAIDISGICNLKCPSCANSLPLIDFPKGFMTLNDFKKITKKIIKEVGLVSHFALYNWGEPLLHPQIDLVINYAHSMGIATSVSTNLSISSSEQLHKLVKSSPDMLKISLSGYFPDTYNKTHTGGDITLVKSNLYRVKHYIEKCKSSFLVEVNYHLYKHNIGIDMSKMKDLCRELGFIFSTTYANFGPVERVIAYCEGNLDSKARDFLNLYLVGIDKALEITKPFHSLPCRFLANQVNINWDRSVSLCCASHNKQRSVICNDFLQETLENIKVLKRDHDVCKTCTKYGIHQYYCGVNQKEWKKEAERYIL